MNIRQLAMEESGQFSTPSWRFFRDSIKEKAKEKGVKYNERIVKQVWDSQFKGFEPKPRKKGRRKR